MVERHGGEIPRTRDEPLALDGVGPYTAGTVLSIAYDLPEALVDGNVQRVFCRLFGLDDVLGSGALRMSLWSLAEELVLSGGGAGTWNQAFMELRWPVWAYLRLAPGTPGPGERRPEARAAVGAGTARAGVGGLLRNRAANSGGSPRGEVWTMSSRCW